MDRIGRSLQRSRSCLDDVVSSLRSAGYLTSERGFFSPILLRNRPVVERAWVPSHRPPRKNSLNSIILLRRLKPKQKPEVALD